jgi:hypothetical protein
MGEPRRLRIIENDALLSIEPARRRVHLGSDRLTPNGVTLFISRPCVASNTLPCHARRPMAAATLARGLPEAMISEPSPSPSGIGPTGLFVNSASSSRRDISSRSWTSNGPEAPGACSGGLMPRSR